MSTATQIWYALIALVALLLLLTGCAPFDRGICTDISFERNDWYFIGYHPGKCTSRTTLDQPVTEHIN